MNRDLRTRVMTALVVLPPLILIVVLGRPWHFSLLVLAATSIGLWEFYRMAFPSRQGERVLGIALGLFVALGIVGRGLSPVVALAAVIMAGFAFVFLFWRDRLGKGYGQWGWILLGTVYIGYLVPHFAILHQSPQGREWIFLVLSVTVAGDTAGYLVGSTLGRRKIAPRVSPNKTVEGTAALLIAGTLAGIFAARLLFAAMSYGQALWLSLILSSLGQVGDLFESWIKRAFFAKDSGALFPGHGGLLDRIDSLILPAVFVTYYLRLVTP